jgi:hypothetical protein
LNENSDLPKDVFEKEKEGDVDLNTVRAFGDFDIDESKWYTHSELKKLYRTVNRQSVPASYDATTLGNENVN